MTPITKPGEADLTDEQIGNVAENFGINRHAFAGAFQAGAALGTAPATPVPADAAAIRMAFLHTSNRDADGYEWGVAKVRFGADGKVDSFLWGASDSSDLDAAMPFHLRPDVLAAEAEAGGVLASGGATPVPAGEPVEKVLKDLRWRLDDIRDMLMKEGFNGQRIYGCDEWSTPTVNLSTAIAVIDKALAAPTSPATQADAAEVGQEAAAVQAAGAWQDIATAPKDGTAVLGLWLPMAGDAAFPRCYAIAHFIEGGWCSVDDDEQTFTDPTHWMPLPAAPADSSMGGGER